MHSMSFVNSDEPQGAAGVSPSRCGSVPQSDELLSNRGFNSVNVTPARTEGNILKIQGGIPGVGWGAQLASMIEHSVRTSPVQCDHSWSGQNPTGGEPLN